MKNPRRPASRTVAELDGAGGSVWKTGTKTMVRTGSKIDKQIKSEAKATRQRLADKGMDVSVKNSIKGSTNTVSARLKEKLKGEK